MKKTTGITLATLGVLGVAGAIKFAKSAIQIYQNNNTAYPGPYEPPSDSYYESLSQSMLEAIWVIKSKTASTQEKLDAALLIKESLLECLTIKELDELTAIYRYKPSLIIIGYDPVEVSKFIYRFYADAKNGRLKPMTERREFVKPEVTESEVSEEEPFKKCFTCDCEDEDALSEDELLAYYEECESIAKYSKIAHTMNKDIKMLDDDSKSKGMKELIEMGLKFQLKHMLYDDAIADLVDLYRDHGDDSNIKFTLPSVCEFVFELRKRYTTMPEAGEYFEVMLDNKDHMKALQTLFEFLYVESELGINRNDYVKDFIYNDELRKLHVGTLTDENGKQSFEFYINDELVAYGDEGIYGTKLQVSFLDNVEELSTKHIPNIMKHLLKDKHNFAKKALSEG